MKTMKYDEFIKWVFCQEQFETDDAIYNFIEVGATIYEVEREKIYMDINNIRQYN